jgi:lysophospholipase L1-like esterase
VLLRATSLLVLVACAAPNEATPARSELDRGAGRPSEAAPRESTPEGAPGEPTSQSAAAGSSEARTSGVTSSDTAPKPLPAKTTVLHVGDSFVHSGLTQRLKEVFSAEGVRLVARAEHSTNSLDWAKRLPDDVSSTQPDLVIVTLGGNEIASKHLDVQARAIRKIVATIGDRPCVWTTPPLWRAEDGLFDTLQANVAPCRFFETDRHVGQYLPRRPDKIHPTAEGGALWADALVSYLRRERVGEPRPWTLTPAPDAERTPAGLRSPLPLP